LLLECGHFVANSNQHVAEQSQVGFSAYRAVSRNDDHFVGNLARFASAARMIHSLHVLDYGAPFGYRLALRHPERVQALIAQKFH
jgi:hypothetical protein